MCGKNALSPFDCEWFLKNIKIYKPSHRVSFATFIKLNRLKKNRIVQYENKTQAGYNKKLCKNYHM